MGIVIDGTFGIDVGYLLPDTPFAGTDGANPFEQFAEIVGAENRLRLFEAFVVHHKTFAEILLQHAGCPLAESRGTKRVHPVTHGNNGIERVKLRKIVLAIGGSCRDFLGN